MRKTILTKNYAKAFKRLILLAVVLAVVTAAAVPLSLSRQIRDLSALEQTKQEEQEEQEEQNDFEKLMTLYSIYLFISDTQRDHLPKPDPDFYQSCLPKELIEQVYRYFS